MSTPQTSSQVAPIGEEEGADETKGSSETASKSSTSHYASGVFPSRGTSTKRRAKGARPLRRDLRREARRIEDGSSIFRMGGQWAVGGVSESEKKSGYQPRLHAGAGVMRPEHCRRKLYHAIFLKLLTTCYELCHARCLTSRR